MKDYQIISGCQDSISQLDFWRVWNKISLESTPSLSMKLFLISEFILTNVNNLQKMVLIPTETSSKDVNGIMMMATLTNLTKRFCSYPPQSSKLFQFTTNQKKGPMTKEMKLIQRNLSIKLQCTERLKEKVYCLRQVIRLISLCTWECQQILWKEPSIGLREE